MFWIEERRGEAIPETWVSLSSKTKRKWNKHTPLMCWIENRRGEAIPKELYYDDW